MLIIIRAATVADVTALLTLWDIAAENARRARDTLEALTAMIEYDSDAVILAEQDGELVGSVIAGWDGWRGRVYRLAVSPACRRQGVATALLQAAEERFRVLGAARVDAMVLDGNTPGQSFWRAGGYSEHDNWRRWVKWL
jgi:ribosomal protein S18 acetylase RimI-like enzyme